VVRVVAAGTACRAPTDELECGETRRLQDYLAAGMCSVIFVGFLDLIMMRFSQSEKTPLE
jgi:hypothetical protein